MKQIYFILFVFILFVACKNKSTVLTDNPKYITPQHYELITKSWNENIYVFTLKQHEYILLHQSRGNQMLHSASCPCHKNR